MNYETLHRFINEEMRMSQVYQPVMLMELLKSNGQASVKQIAQAILDKDPTQIEYFSEIVKNMVGRVLTKNRGITEKQGDTYKLIGSDQLSSEQVADLVALCQSTANPSGGIHAVREVWSDFAASGQCPALASGAHVG